MKVYSPSDIADLLNIKPATLRKYSILLEKHGYKIERNSQGHRYYRDKDIMTLRNVITGTKSGVTLEESIINVINLDGGNSVINATNNGVIAHDNDIRELKDMVYKQNELIRELSKQLDKQQEYIDKRLIERDQILMQRLEQSLEEQKRLVSNEQKNKGLFNRLFNKG